MTDIKSNLKYTDDHDWVLVEGDVATVGISDFAQNALGDIVFVEVPEVGAEVERGETFGVLESIKSANDLISPISGEVIESNEELSDSPEKCNEAPYEAWIMKVRLSNPAEIEELMDAEKYQEHCEAQA